MISGQARFRRADRLRDGRDYRRLASTGRRAASKNYVVLAVHRRTDGVARLGITASRRVGGAVQRNRVKRTIREWFRIRQQELTPDLDVVVIARSSAVGLSGREVAVELTRLTREAAG
jgi:ribonuclease P protein component